MRREDIPDDRSRMARAAAWAADATTVAVEMVIPIVIGAWADTRLGTRGLFAVIGAAVGITMGIWTLTRMVRTLSRKNRDAGPLGRQDKPKP